MFLRFKMKKFNTIIENGRQCKIFNILLKNMSPATWSKEFFGNLKKKPYLKEKNYEIAKIFGGF